MRSSIIRQRFVFLLLGALTLGALLSHGFVHHPGDFHEATCSLCVLGAALDLPQADDLLAYIWPPLEFAVPPPAKDFIPASPFVPGLFSPRGPPLG